MIPDWLQPVVRAAEHMTADDLTRFVPPEDADTRRGAVLMLFGAQLTAVLHCRHEAADPSSPTGASCAPVAAD